MYTCTGGQLVFQLGGMNEFGEMSGSTRHATNFWINLDNIYTQMHHEGKITQVDNYLDICFTISWTGNTYYTYATSLLETRPQNWCR